MEINLPILLFFICIPSAAYCQNNNALTEVAHFGNNPGNLKMFIHAASLPDTNKLPLVIVLHGCSQTAGAAAELTGWNKLADINHFVVIYPQQKIWNNPDLCFNWFNKQEIEKDKGESASIYEMILFAIEHYPVDSTRVFISGFSAGGTMCVVMMATHPELFKSGAVFAGGAYKMATNFADGFKEMLGSRQVSNEQLVNNVREQNPEFKGHYPTMIIYQGLNDPIVHHKNADILVRQWTGLNGSDSIFSRAEKSYMGIADISRVEYHNTSGKTVVIFYEVKNLGHRLMIKPGNKANEGGHLGWYGINKGFHSTYQVAKEFGIIK